MPLQHSPLAVQAALGTRQLSVVAQVPPLPQMSLQQSAPELHDTAPSAQPAVVVTQANELAMPAVVSESSARGSRMKLSCSTEHWLAASKQLTSPPVVPVEHAAARF